jgi:hypothetical protein
VLERFLADHRLPAELQARPLRTGDTFAVRARRDLRAHPPTIAERQRPEEWFASPIYDISADARDVAKSAFYGAVAPTLDAIRVGQIEEIVERPPQPAPSPGHPGGRFRVRWLTTTAVLFVAGVGAGIAVGSVVGGDTTTTTTTVRSRSTVTKTVTKPVTTTETQTETQTETVTETVTTEAAPKPDLIVSIAADGVQVSCDGDVCVTTVRFEVANISPQADVAQPFTVSITSNAPTESGTVTETVMQTVDSLAADSTLSLSTELPARALCTDSDCVMTIDVDSAGVITESNEDNNKAEASPPAAVG